MEKEVMKPRNLVVEDLEEILNIFQNVLGPGRSTGLPDTQVVFEHIKTYGRAEYRTGCKWTWISKLFFGEYGDLPVYFQLNQTRIYVPEEYVVNLDKGIFLPPTSSYSDFVKMYGDIARSEGLSDIPQGYIDVTELAKRDDNEFHMRVEEYLKRLLGTADYPPSRPIVFLPWSDVRGPAGEKVLNILYNYLKSHDMRGNPLNNERSPIYMGNVYHLFNVATHEKDGKLPKINRYAERSHQIVYDVFKRCGWDLPLVGIS